MARQEHAAVDVGLTPEEIQELEKKISDLATENISLEGIIKLNKAEIKENNTLIKSFVEEKERGFRTESQLMDIVIDQGQWQKVFIDPDSGDEVKREQLPDGYVIDIEDEIINPIEDNSEED